MAIDFPTSPVDNQFYDYQGIRYTYVGTGATGYWRVIHAGQTGSATVTQINSGTTDSKYVTPVGLEGSKYEAGLHADGVSYDNSDGGLDATANTVQAAIRAVLEERPNPNLILNGDFQVWQRGDSFVADPISEYTADRWVSFGGKRVDKSNQVPSGTPFVQSVLVTNSVPLVRNVIELPKVGKAGIFQTGETFTLSGWVAINGTLSAHMRFSDDSSMTNHVDILPITNILTGTGAWEKFEHTFTISGSGVPIPTSSVILTTLYSSTTTEILLTGIKLERGGYATRFEVESYGDTLRKCQRYYQVQESPDYLVGFSGRNDTRQRFWVYPWATEMRATPVVVGSGFNSRLESIDTTGCTSSMCMIYGYAESDSATASMQRITAEAEL